MLDYYDELLEDLLRRRVLTTDMRILVVAGGPPDADALRKFGFRDVVISNLDTRMRGDEYAPFEWSFQDAEQISFADGSFDFVLEHWGLHHCHSPHRALCEMYRVARRGIVLFEPVDNLLSRLSLRFGVGQAYELASVYYNDFEHGGVRNTEIPNYVYRWTEREVRKTVESFAPVGTHRYEFHYALITPWMSIRGRRDPLSRIFAGAAISAARLASRLVPRLANTFAAVVLKPELPAELHPWLEWRDDEVRVSRDYLTRRYRALD